MTAPSNDPAPRHDPYAAFRFPDYRFYTVGSLVVLIGVQVQSVAIGWEMYRRTGEALALGLVGLVQAIPMFALTLPAGYLADRFNRRAVVMVSLVGTTLTSLLLAWLSYEQKSIAWMYGILFLDAAALSIGRPARQAMLPQMVPPQVLANATAWRSSAFQVAMVCGPAVGGFVVAWNVTSAFLISAASTAIFAVLLTQLKFPYAAQSAARTPLTLESMLAGIGFLKRHRLMLAAISLDMFAVLLGGATYLMPMFAKDILRVGPTGLGWLNAAPAAGSFCMAMVLAHAPPLRNAGRKLLWAVAAFGVATILFGISQSFWLSLAMLFLTGMFDNVSMVVRHTLMQLLTPDYMRGRMSALNSMFIGTSNEVGGFRAGLVAQFFGPVISVVAGGVGTLMVVGATAWASPSLRRFDDLNATRPLEEVEPEPRRAGEEEALS